MRRAKLEAKATKQDNDCRCFRRGSKENKAAKRLSSKRIRRILKREQDDQVD